MEKDLLIAAKELMISQLKYQIQKVRSNYFYNLHTFHLKNTILVK